MRKQAVPIAVAVVVMILSGSMMINILRQSDFVAKSAVIEPTVKVGIGRWHYAVYCDGRWFFWLGTPPVWRSENGSLASDQDFIQQCFERELAAKQIRDLKKQSSK